MTETTPADSLTRSYLVAGRVQGVFFRASTREQALALGMSGHAINLPDGRVEVVARGSASAHCALFAWLHDGPPDARVTLVESATTDATVGDGFRTG